MSAFSEQLTAALDGLVSVTPGQTAQLEAHYRLLEQWNRRMNLSSIRREEEAVLRHYAECTYFAKLLGEFATEVGLVAPAVADVGSGAGFPGVPVGIVHPLWKITLIESHQRKTVFLREATRGIPNIDVLPRRAEAVEHHFDIAISRAVDPTEVLGLSIAPNVGLLLGADDVPRGTNGRVVKLPWGDKRVALFVSR